LRGRERGSKGARERGSKGEGTGSRGQKVPPRPSHHNLDFRSASDGSLAPLLPRSLFSPICLFSLVGAKVCVLAFATMGGSHEPAFPCPAV
jgi:hypothetical protein